MPASRLRLAIPAAFTVFSLLAGPVALAALPTSDSPWDQPFHSDTAAIARAAAAVAAQGDDPVVVLRRDIAFRYDEAGREFHVERVVYKLATGAAHESWSTVHAAWAPWYQERPEIRARVVLPDGSSQELDPKVIAENGAAPSAPDMFEEHRLLRAPLPATGPGVVIEQEITIRGRRPWFDRGVAHRVTLAGSFPPLRARLTLDLPEAMPLAWVTRRLPELPPADQRQDGRRRLTFDFAGLPKDPELPPGLPPEAPRSAYVAFATASSWNAVASRYAEIVDQAIRGSDVSSLVKAAAGAPSHEDAIGRILAAMASIRYTGVELGEGGVVPRSPAETLRRRFGDCKDKATLLVAALRALEIPAFVALLSASEDEPDIEPQLPGFGGFNHAIVVVPGTPPLWIDPTDPYARLGELPAADQGRFALVASPDAAALTRTPEALSAENQEIENREFSLAELGPARVVETTEYHGSLERTMRSAYAAAKPEDLRRQLAGYVEERYLAKQLSGLEFTPPDRLREPFRLKLEMAQSPLGFTDLAAAAAALPPADLLSRMPEDLQAEPEDAEKEEPGKLPVRSEDYYFSRPFQLELRSRIVPPAGYLPRDLPEKEERTLGAAALSRQYSAEDRGVVTAVWRLDSGPRRHSPEQLAALRNGLREIAEAEPVMIHFEHVGEARLLAGDIRAAVAEFQREVAGAPKRALPRTRLSRALLAGGLGEAARREAEQAVALEPASALAHRNLGWVLEHDDLGRRFGRGFSRDRALAEYRKARELDPQDAVARASLAILLEHDDAGHRYAAGADLAAAIDEYRSLRRDIEGEKSMDDNLLIALIHAGKLEELEPLLAELPDNETRKQAHLVSLAALKSPDAALREAERTWTEPGQRLTALTAAAGSLIQARRYPEAAELMQRAGQLSPQAASLLAITEVLRRTRRHEDIVLDPASPETPLRQLMLSPIRGYTKDRIRPLLSRRMALEGDRQGDEEFRRTFDLAARKLKQDLAFDVAVDIGLAALRGTVSGNDTTGYRVELTATAGATQTSYLGFVVREEGQHRLAAVRDTLEILGLEALDRLKNGDLAAARQWLDWAREELKEPPGTDGDPLRRNALAVLWIQGDPGGESTVRCAAAALAAETADESVRPLLERCRQEATAAEDAGRQLALDLALLKLELAQHRYTAASAVAQRLITAYPKSQTAFQLLAASLALLEDRAALRRLAEERLQAHPEDEKARRLLAQIAGADGDLPLAETWLRQLAEATKPEPGVLNDLAWNQLLQGRADSQALDWAQRAATASEYHNSAFLHTLAALYAEQGKVQEAYKILLQALDERPDPSPTLHDWYVIGRLAEQYGLPEEARRIYRRALPATSAKSADRTDSRYLIEQRLELLGPEPKRAKPGNPQTVRIQG